MAAMHTSRHSWPAAFVDHVLRRGLADDPDWAYDVAEEVYPVWVNCDPEVAAELVFGVRAALASSSDACAMPFGLRPRIRTGPTTLPRRFTRCG
jgi:hypothetical protein